VQSKDRCERTVEGGAPRTGSRDATRNKPSFARLPPLHSSRSGADAECHRFCSSASITRASARLDVDFFSRRSYREIGFSPIPESTVRPIVRSLGRNVISRTVTVTTAIRLSDQEKLETLRRLDQFRQWHSLDEKRYCLVCGNLITGRQIQVAGGTRGDLPLRLNCPTERCNSIPMDWVLPTDEVLARVERLAEEERKASALKPAAVTIGNGQTIHRDKSHEHFVSRLRRLAFHLKRHAKLSPLIPAGLEPPGGSAG
jgi:hypothetical protein